MCIRGLFLNYGFIVSKEGKTLNAKKIEVLLKMSIPKTTQEIQVFNEMAQFYICFIINFASTMVPITKLLKKIENILMDFWVWNSLGKHQELVHSSSYTY
jgi:hypothetical protein